MHLSGCQTLVLALVALFAIIIVAGCLVGLTGSTQTPGTATPTPIDADAEVLVGRLYDCMQVNDEFREDFEKGFEDGFVLGASVGEMTRDAAANYAERMLSSRENFMSAYQLAVDENPSMRGLFQAQLEFCEATTPTLRPTSTPTPIDAAAEFLAGRLYDCMQVNDGFREGLYLSTLPMHADLEDVALFFQDLVTENPLMTEYLQVWLEECENAANGQTEELTEAALANRLYDCIQVNDEFREGSALGLSSTQDDRELFIQVLQTLFAEDPSIRQYYRTELAVCEATTLSATPRPVPTPTPSPTTATPTPEPGGGWETFTYVDNLTEKSHTGVLLVAAWSTGGLLESVDITPARLVFKCDREAGLFGYFEWPDSSFLYGDPFNGNKLPVEYVVDEARHTAWWIEFGGGAVRVAPEDLQVFIDRVSSATSLGIQFRETEWFENNEKARFDISGISWALRQLPCSIPPLMSTLSQTKQSLVRVEVHDAAGSGVVIGKNNNRSLVVTGVACNRVILSRSRQRVRRG